jgi:hypothetical protein
MEIVGEIEGYLVEYCKNTFNGTSLRFLVNFICIFSVNSANYRTKIGRFPTEKGEIPHIRSNIPPIPLQNI